MWKVARGYVRELPGWAEADQEAVIMSYAEARGWQCTIVRESEQGRALWLRLLRNSDRQHVAIVATLDVLALPGKSGKGRPLAEMMERLAEVQASAAMVVDARGDVSTESPKKWAQHVRAVGDRIASGRPLPPDVARKMARKRWAETPPERRGVAKAWLAPWRADELARYTDMWTSARYRGQGDEAVRAAINADLERRKMRDLLLGSVSTCRRVFKNRGKR
jgi:hypothetical protein